MAPSLPIAKDIICELAESLRLLADQLDGSFQRAVEIILAGRGQVVVTGIGKSGHIGGKAAATLASTGTPAIFMHPVEGMHGDLGVVSQHSVLLALSKSGATEELVRFVNHFRRIGGHVIVVCEDPASPLSELADVVLQIPRRPEAGPLALCLTTSTLMMLALCDALAMALLHARGFGVDDFARFHPDGSLGRRLLLRASDLMHRGKELPSVQSNAGFNDLLIEMTGKHLGMACVVEKDKRLIGVFTDGDLRRLLIRCEHPQRLTAVDAMRQSRRDPSEPLVRCSTVPPTTLAVDCLRMMRESEITVLVVSSDGAAADGVIRLQDLIRAGLG